MSNQTKHTPAPWTQSPTATPEWAKQYSVYAENDNTGKDIALIYDGKNSEANARLIAAAPDLLEALQRLHDIARPQLDKSATNDGLTNCDILAQARAAISKATT